jgi:hypothetical protein
LIRSAGLSLAAAPHRSPPRRPAGPAWGQTSPETRPDETVMAPQGPLGFAAGQGRTVKFQTVAYVPDHDLGWRDCRSAFRATTPDDTRRPDAGSRSAECGFEEGFQRSDALGVGAERRFVPGRRSVRRPTCLRIRRCCEIAGPNRWPRSRPGPGRTSPTGRPTPSERWPPTSTSKAGSLPRPGRQDHRRRAAGRTPLRRHRDRRSTARPPYGPPGGYHRTRTRIHNHGGNRPEKCSARFWEILVSKRS